MLTCPVSNRTLRTVLDTPDSIGHSQDTLDSIGHSGYNCRCFFDAGSAAGLFTLPPAAYVCSIIKKSELEVAIVCPCVFCFSPIAWRDYGQNTPSVFLARPALAATSIPRRSSSTSSCRYQKCQNSAIPRTVPVHAEPESRQME